MVKCGMCGREIEKEVRDSRVKCRVCGAPLCEGCFDLFSDFCREHMPRGEG